MLFQVRKAIELRKIHHAPSPCRLLFWHLDSPLGQLHPHPASENGERNARNKYVLSVFWAHHPTKNGVEKLRLFFSVSFVFALFCGSCRCRSLFLQNLVRGTVQAWMSFRLVLPSATLCASMPSQVLPFFRMVFRMYCDILLYC